MISAPENATFTMTLKWNKQFLIQKFNNFDNFFDNSFILSLFYWIDLAAYAKKEVLLSFYVNFLKFMLSGVSLTDVPENLTEDHLLGDPKNFAGELFIWRPNKSQKLKR